MRLSSHALSLLLVTFSLQELQVAGSSFVPTGPTRTSSTRSTGVRTRPTARTTRTVNYPEHGHEHGHGHTPKHDLLGPAHHINIRPSFILQMGKNNEKEENSRATMDSSSSDDATTNTNNSSNSSNGNSNGNKVEKSMQQEIDSAKSAIKSALIPNPMNPPVAAAATVSASTATLTLVTEEFKQQKAEISALLKQQGERDTNINRLKFQLNELKQSLSVSQVQKKEMEDTIQSLKLQKETLEGLDKDKGSLGLEGDTVRIE